MKNNYFKFLLVVLLVVSLVSIGYAAFTIDLDLEKISAMFRLQTDIRITNITLDSKSDDAYTNYEEYNVKEIIAGVKLPTNDSYITYKIDVTNFGATKMVLSNITGLPSNLTYTIDNYELNHLICDNNDKCNLGITKSIYLTIRQKNTLTQEDNIEYDLNLSFEFSELSYNIQYFHLYLPSEYQEVEYIESTGTQRINTKYIPKTNTKIELDLSFSGTFDISSGTVGTGTFFSSYSSGGNIFSVNFGSASTQGNNLFTWFDKNQDNGGSVHYYDINNTVRTTRSTLTYEKGTFKYGTLNAKTVAVKSEDSTSPLYLFGNSTKNFDRYNMKVYRLKFYEDGVLKRDYIPCYRISDGKVGIYELLTGNFYTNIGTGEFNKGSDIIDSSIEKSYSTTQTIKYDENFYMDNPVYVKDNYLFLGWNTKKDGTGSYYQLEEPMVNLSNVNGMTIKLYPKWKIYVTLNINNVIKEDAVMDNSPSTFVTNDTGINFLEPSSDENGKGIYVINETINDENPIYYYRGDVKNNNVIFANFCWKILRTTSTGGVKLLYNGISTDGSCNNTGWDTQITSGVYFNPTSISIAGAGYSYTNTSDLVMKSKKDANVTTGTIFSYNIDYNEENKKYTLIGDKVTTNTNFTTEKYDQLHEHHYTCFKTVDEECDTVSYVYMARDNNIYYAILSNGMKGIEDILHIDFEGGSTNATPSTLQTTINNWYQNNMTEYTDYLEDTVYCNDRSIYNPWNLTSSIANDDNLKLNFGAKGRIAFTGKPTVECKYKADSFTVSPENGNGVLPYPVGTISYDEAALAGVPWWISSNDNFLNNGKVWWTMSPGFISTTGVYNGIISSQLDHVAVNWRGTKTTVGTVVNYQGGGVRPVISLKPGLIIENGFGTVDKPFTFENIEITE